MHTVGHGSPLHNNQRVGTTQMPINWRIDKQMRCYQYSGMLFNYKKEWSTSTCYNMDESWKQYAKWKKPHTTGNIMWFHLYQISRINKFIETAD